MCRQVYSGIGVILAAGYIVIARARRKDIVLNEGKELNDLMSFITIGRERFEEELHEGKSLDYFALVVERSLVDIPNGRYRSQMNAKSAVQSLLAFFYPLQAALLLEMKIWSSGHRKFACEVYDPEITKKFEAVENTSSYIKKQAESSRD